MQDEEQIPLQAVRGLGPLAAARIAACGIATANQLACTAVSDFKQRCPQYHRKADSFIRAARRLMRKAGIDITSEIEVEPQTTPGQAEQREVLASEELPQVDREGGVPTPGDGEHETEKRAKQKDKEKKRRKGKKEKKDKKEKKKAGKKEQKGREKGSKKGDGNEKQKGKKK